MRIDVACTPDAGGWICQVLVGEDARATRHEVLVAAAQVDRLDPGATDPTSLVRRSFAFLLAREPRESILRSFELEVIGRYFPEWEAEIRTGSGGG